MDSERIRQVAKELDDARKRRTSKAYSLLSPIIVRSSC